MIAGPQFDTLDGKDLLLTGWYMYTSQLTLILMCDVYWLLRQVLSNNVSMFQRKLMTYYRQVTTQR